jgi:3-deoxy-manno-octulosonate cytidylyltransferase (CMP-KDO synthetase)
MRIVAIIPARYASTRFPGKPLALISGKPMVEHVYSSASACDEISGVYVATDDNRIYDLVVGFGGKALMTGSGHTSGTDRIAEAADKISLDEEDIIVNVQGDQPLFPPSVLADMVAPFYDDEGLSMSTLMYRIRNSEEITNPNHVKVVTDARGFALYFSRHPIPFYREQGQEAVHFKHLGFYAYRKSFLKIFTSLPEGRLEAAEKLEQLRALENGFRIRVVETTHDSPEVDTPEDIARVEVLIEQAPMTRKC